jgi:hypothetical protein
MIRRTEQEISTDFLCRLVLQQGVSFAPFGAAFRLHHEALKELKARLLGRLDIHSPFLRLKTIMMSICRQKCVDGSIFGACKACAGNPPR